MLSKLFRKRRSTENRTYSRPSGANKRRRLQFQRLVDRELLAADLGVITGQVFIDLAGDENVSQIVDTTGATVNDPPLEGVTVTLYNDNVNPGVLDLAGGDTLAGTFVTGADGIFRFEGLSIGDYLLVQSPVAGLNPANTSAIPVTIVNDGVDVINAIDDFSVTQTLIQVLDDAAPTEFSSVSDPTILGGHRVIILDNIDDGVAGPGGGAGVQVQVTNNELQFDSFQQAVLQATVQYDGDNDGTSPLNPTGLGGVDLVMGNLGAGLLFSSRADQAGGEVIVRVFSDADNASETQVLIPQQITFDQFFVPFDAFTQLGVDGPADFENVGAVEFQINGVPSLDGALALIGSAAPIEVVQNLANFEPITLGGEVFRDFDNSGFRELGEPGIEGVTVNLYADDGNGSLNIPGDTFLATTTTDANGSYRFEGLNPGSYLIQVPTSEFAAGEALFGHSTSTGPQVSINPDDNIKNDDNGLVVAGLGVATNAITLVSRGEPINDGDTDPNTNLTLDLGFVPETDLQLSKTLLTNTPIAGEEATFLITVRNNGNSVATNIEIEDVIPAGMVFNRIQSASPGLVPSVTNGTLTVTTASLGINQEIQFELVVDILSSTTGPIVINTAAVTATEQDPIPDNNTDQAEVPITIVTDLRLEKSSSHSTIGSGAELTYTIIVSNDGPSDATGVVVTDVLPTGVTFVSGNVGGDNTLIDDTAGTITANVGDLANGAQQTITIVTAVDGNAPDQLTNSATVTNVPLTDNNPDNNDAAVTVDVLRQVDLAITKSVVGDAIAGELLTFTFVVDNNGPGDARGVTVTDTLNEAFAFESFAAGTSGATVTPAGQDLEFNLGTIAAGGQATFSIDVMVDPSVSHGSTIPNTAVVSTTDADTDTSNNSFTVPVPIQRLTDVTIQKSANAAAAIPGQSLSYTITVSNLGPSDAANVQFIDNLPPGFTTTSITDNGIPFVLVGSELTFNVGTLAAGETATVQVNGNIASGATGDLINNVEVQTSDPESDPDNNTAEITTPLTPQFDVAISKTGPETIISGQELTYTIVVTNANGPSDATGVLITDTLPAGTTFVSGSLGGSTPTVNGNQVAFDPITIPTGGSVTATLIVSTDPNATGTLTNTANVSADPGDTNPNNNSSTINTTLVPDIDVTVSKSASAATAQVGSEVTFTIDVTNLGNTAAQGVTAIDVLPAGMTFVSGSGPQGQTLSATGQTVNVNIGTLAGNATSSFTIVAAVDAGATGTVVNNVSVTTTSTETNTDNNSATAAVEIDPLQSRISGEVYIDQNNDGVRDPGEPGIPNVTINLTGIDSQGNPVAPRSTTTDANGSFEFTNLPAGTYSIQQVQPEGFLDGQDRVGTVAGTPTGQIAESDLFTGIVVGPTEAAVSFQFGELSMPFSKRMFLASAR